MIVINGGSTPMINNVPPKSMLPRKMVYTVYTMHHNHFLHAQHQHFHHFPHFSQLSISAREVDVGRACDVAFLQDLKAFIDQRIEEPRATGRCPPIHRPQPDIIQPDPTSTVEGRFGWKIRWGS